MLKRAFRTRKWHLLQACFLGVALSLPAAASGLGCNMTLVLRNTSDEIVDIDASSFQVRSRTGGVAGPWRRVQNGGWRPEAVIIRLQPNAETQGVYETALLCQDRRQFRIDYTCRSGRRIGQSFDMRVPQARRDWHRYQNLFLPVGERCD